MQSFSQIRVLNVLFKIIPGLVLFFSATLATAEPTCYTKTWSDARAEYCIQAPSSGSKKNDTLLIYLHGLGGNARNWFEWEPVAKVQRKLVERSEDSWVLTVSFGAVWLLTEIPSSDHLHAKFVQDILPEAEMRMRPGGFTQRILVGASMGGFNASQLLFKNPELFQKVALLCPAITQLGPYASLSEVQDYIRRTGADPRRAYAMHQLTRREFKSAEDWNMHAPLQLAQKSRALPQTYVSCGLEDSYGFQEGAELLAKAIQGRASDVTWAPLPGQGHCAVDAKSVVEFLTK